MFRIVGLPDSGTQLLPESYVRLISRWTVENRRQPQSSNHDDDSNNGNIPFLQLVRYQEGQLYPTPTQGTTGETKQDCNHNKNDDDGVRIRPTLDFLIKNGVPAYVMVGLQTLQQATETTCSSVMNRRRYSYLAQQWIAWDLLAVATINPNFRIVLYVGHGDGTDQRIFHAGQEQLRPAVEQLGNILSLEQTVDLSLGFHILSIPIWGNSAAAAGGGASSKDEEGVSSEPAKEEWISLESMIRKEVLEYQQDDPAAAAGTKDILVTCLATAEMDAREFFTLDPELVEMTATSVLQLPLSDLLIRLQDDNNNDIKSGE